MTNSKFWYEVRKKITEILDNKRAAGRRRSSCQDDDDSEDEIRDPRRLCKQDTVDSIVSEVSKRMTISMYMLREININNIQDELETEESDEKEKLNQQNSNDSLKSY